MRVAYFGSDAFIDCARLLVERGWPIIRVFTCRTDGPIVSGDELTRYARKIGAPVQRRKASAGDLARLDGEVVVLVSALYPWIIPVAASSARAINIHPTLLPEGRGAYPLVNVLLRGLPETGVTVHEMDAHFDTGAILRQGRLAIGPGERAGTLQSRTHALAVDLLSDVLDDFEGLWEHRRPQVGGDYWAAPNESDRRLDMTATVDELLARMRAFGIYGTQCVLNGRPVEVIGVTGEHRPHDHPPGTVVGKSDTNPEIAVADGIVRLTVAPRRPLHDAAMRARRLGWAVDDRIRARLS